MAKLSFKKPKLSVLMSEVITLTIWLFLGDRVISILDGIVGQSYNLNVSGAGTSWPALTSVDGCTNNSIFQDAFEITGIGYACQDWTTNAEDVEGLANRNNGLIGVIGLVMVVMVLMNFVTYR